MPEQALVEEGNQVGPIERLAAGILGDLNWWLSAHSEHSLTLAPHSFVCHQSRLPSFL